MKVIETHIKTKLIDFIHMAKKEFKLEDELDSNLRLRQYKPKEDLMTETFTGMDDREILYLGVTANKCYALERKGDDENFGEYDPLVIKVKCSLWEEGILTSDSDNCKQIYISIGKRRPIRDFENLIRKNLNIPDDEDFFIFKRRVISDTLKETVLINSEENLIYSLDEMKIYEATRVLIERGDSGRKITRPPTLEQFDESTSRWVDIVERENYTLLIRFNLPSLTPNSEMAIFNQEILIDSRLTLADMKKMISESMEIEEEKFTMKRGGKVGIELTDLTKSLIKCGLVSGSVIYTAFGTPTKPGEILIKMLMTVKEDQLVSHHYNLKPITEVAIDQNSTAEEAIKRTIETFKKYGGEISGLEFRLREKHSRSLTKVYRNVSLKKQGIHEGKQLVIENIDPKIQIPNLDLKQYLLVIQFINPETIQLEDIFELAVDKNDSLSSVAQRVYEKCQKVPLEFMTAAKVTTVWGLDRFYGVTLPYQHLNDSKNQIGGQPFFLSTDGIVFLIKDSRKSFREPTEDEKRSLKGRAQFMEDTYDFTAINISRVKVKPKEKGVKIYATRKDKEDDQQKAKEREEREKTSSPVKNNEPQQPKKVPEQPKEQPKEEPEEADMTALF